MSDENELERALAAACADPVRWMDFYRCLRDSHVFFGNIGDPADLDERGVPRTLTVPTVDHLNERRLTLFTSRERLAGSLGKECSSVRVQGLVILRLWGHVPVFVNPGHRYSVSLPADLVAAIADGSIFKRPPARKVELKKPGSVRIETPPEPQVHITRALAALFATRDDVISARLAWWIEEGAEDPPHAVIAIEARGPLQPIAAAADAALQGILPPNVTVDYIDLGATLLEQKIRSVAEPFYHRGDN